MELYIKHVQAKGFKAVTDSRMWTLYPYTSISGENSQGKTTIGDAITYCLYGCNLTGSNKMDELMNKGSKEMYVGVTAVIDGVDRIISRHRKGNTTTVTVDNRKVNQDELYRLIPPKNVFLSIFSPYYFPGLTEAEGRALIGGYLQPVNKDEILNSLSEYERNFLMKQPFLDVNVYLSELKDDLKQHITDITKEEGALEQYRKDELEAGREMVVDGNRVRELEMALSECRVQQQKELQELQAKKEDMIRRKALLVHRKPNLISMPQSEAEPELISTEALEQKLNELRAEYRYTKQQLDKMKTLEPGNTCPNCMQVMDEAHITSAMKQLEQELYQINSTAQSYKSDLNRLIEKNQEIQAAQKRVVEKERQRIRLENEAIEKQYEKDRMEEEGKLRAEEEQINRKMVVIRDRHRMENEQIENELQKVRAEQQRAELHNQRRQEIKEKIALMEENIRDYTTEKEQLEQTMSAAKSYILKQVELQSEQLKPHLNHVEIRMKEIVKSTGESKDCFKVTYDGKTVGQLSASERIKAALEISHLMKQLSGYMMPVFVDNVESITSRVKPDEGQCMECKVVAGQELLIKEVC